jgi:hypothetical protein
MMIYAGSQHSIKEDLQNLPEAVKMQLSYANRIIFHQLPFKY